MKVTVKNITGEELNILDQHYIPYSINKNHPKSIIISSEWIKVNDIYKMLGRPLKTVKRKFMILYFDIAGLADNNVSIQQYFNPSTYVYVEHPELYKDCYVGVMDIDVDLSDKEIMEEMFKVSNADPNYDGRYGNKSLSISDIVILSDDTGTSRYSSYIYRGTGIAGVFIPPHAYVPIPKASPNQTLKKEEEVQRRDTYTSPKSWRYYGETN